MHTRALSVGLAGLSLPLFAATTTAQCELEVLAPPVPEADDRFGYDVALDGQTLFVSSVKDDDAAPDTGAVYVYVHAVEAPSGRPADDSWTLIQKLTASDAGAGDEYGHAMAVQGNLAVIGATRDSRGSAYVYARDDQGTADPLDDVWHEIDKITPSLPVTVFGLSLALHDGTIASGTRTGDRAFVFERDDNGTPRYVLDDSWVETAQISASDGGAGGAGASFSYAWSVGLTRDTLLVGARRDDELVGNSGSTYVYVRFDPGTPQDRFDDTWVETFKFIADPPVLGGQFGRDIAVQGDLAVIGASSADTDDSGLAYLFARHRRGTQDPFDDVWLQVDTLFPSDAGIADEFGQGVALWGDLAVVGSFKHDVDGIHRPGAVYVYQRQDMGTQNPFDDAWPEVARLVASDLADRDWLGINVAVQGNLVVGGAPMTNTASANVRPGKALLWAMECEPLVVDFETEDDFLTPLTNGQDVESLFGDLVVISGAGNTNGLPPTVFDTDPGGPNDPCQDLDLLVGTGNALILQEGPLQTVPGIFDRPNDDGRGGQLRFDFLRPVELFSVDLIDIDPIAGQRVIVTLQDEAGRERTITVPTGFTGDRYQDGAPGYGRLDLRRTSPQVGYRAATSVTQEAGFDPGAVLALGVDFGGSAALDNLRFVPQRARRLRLR